ncbi:Uncharacterized membrane protein, DUF441 family [Desulfonispora thiosulfatigenes DSM 11270]|uniref:UPF0756 membrane protein SAMN00017405_2077 n=1 Tax=Desulfonispora thiosulfatigenes DSM 11270 TaxID=656914 RepID=A0A1W1VH04_DESTI|nr:DUF441 domain-containing protein [Desulfonispora thiosulfatigenes]SMB92657.1 Uncharacterized membrane protein, DUF441 family [Desulfonispora thiosulfatigenes DSM 11270]
MLGEGILLILILIGVLGHSNILAASACVLLVMKLSNLSHYFDLISRRGLEVGLLFLMLSVLVPFASDEMNFKDMLRGIFSWPGFFCAVGGAIATYMNGAGLSMLKVQPELMTGLVVGAIVGIVVFKGVPVGPLMSAGLAAFFMQIFNFIKG